jgi:hypothetical protein
MGKLQFLNGVSRSFHRVGFKVKKHSPEILMAVGVVGTVTSAVMACKATTKLSEILDETKESVDQVHDVKSNPMFTDIYSEKDAKKDLTIIYTQAGLKLVKLYGPAVALGVASISCMLASNNILHKRNAALAAAYASAEHGFKEYRNRVIERFGKELDHELKYDIKAKEVEETVVDENGETKVVKKTVNVVGDPTACSPYARFFDETCTGWERDAEHNLFFLVQCQNYANDKLRSQGHLTLNEVYDMLGMQRSQAGMVVGWVYGGEGDNYVDFGIHDVHNEQKRLFVNGYERSILVDFNVDGDIYKLMK